MFLTKKAVKEQAQPTLVVRKKILGARSGIYSGARSEISVARYTKTTQHRDNIAQNDPRYIKQSIDHFSNLFSFDLQSSTWPILPGSWRVLLFFRKRLNTFCTVLTFIPVIALMTPSSKEMWCWREQTSSGKASCISSGMRILSPLDLLLEMRLLMLTACLERKTVIRIIPIVTLNRNFVYNVLISSVACKLGKNHPHYIFFHFVRPSAETPGGL